MTMNWRKVRNGKVRTKETEVWVNDREKGILKWRPAETDGVTLHTTTHWRKVDHNNPSVVPYPPEDSAVEEFLDSFGGSPNEYSFTD